MKFFISGETDKSVDKCFNEARKEVENRLKTLTVKDYGSAVNCISIFPIIVTTDLIQLGFFKERTLFLRKEKDCDYRLQVNLQRFLTSDKELQQLLLLKVLIETIRSIGLKTTKAKLDFDSLSLEKDIFKLFNIKSTDIDLISRK
jgi:Immunity protein 44